MLPAVLVSFSEPDTPTRGALNSAYSFHCIVDDGASSVLERMLGSEPARRGAFLRSAIDSAAIADFDTYDQVVKCRTQPYVVTDASCHGSCQS